MKRFIAVMLFLGYALTISGAQELVKLKALIVIQDDYADSELNNIATGVKKDYSLVTKFLDTLQTSKVVNVEKTLISGKTATKDNLVRLLKNMQMTDKDLFFFYFSGHGGIKGKRTFLYTTEEGQLFRDELDSLVASRPARLKMIFTDTCSSSIEAMSARGLPKAADKDTANPYIEIYRQLFLQHQGTIHFAAASEGEYAWSADSGGLFTKSLFSEILLQNPKMTWTEIVKETQERTQEKFSLMVNMGLLDRSTMKDLEDRGIKTQMPKTYAMPKTVTTTVATTSGQGSTTSVAATTEVTSSNTSGSTLAGVKKVTIENLTQKNLTINVSTSLNQPQTDNKIHKIGPGKIVEIPFQRVFYLFLGEKPRGDYWEMESGAFVLDNNELGEIELYWDTPAVRSNSKNPMLGEWIWEEYWEDENKVFTMSMEFDEDGFFYLYNSKDDSELEGTWKIHTKGKEQILTIRYKIKGKAQAETFAMHRLEAGSYELENLEDEAVYVLMTKK